MWWSCEDKDQGNTLRARVWWACKGPAGHTWAVRLKTKSTTTRLSVSPVTGFVRHPFHSGSRHLPTLQHWLTRTGTFCCCNPPRKKRTSPRFKEFLVQVPLKERNFFITFCNSDYAVVGRGRGCDHPDSWCCGAGAKNIHVWRKNVWKWSLGLVRCRLPLKGV